MKTALIIMAAGIGSRFGGGIKQLEPVGPNGEIIMDYSIYDAIEAGFNRIVFIIRRDIEADFREVIGDRIEAVCAKRGVSVGYAFQSLTDIPQGAVVPEGRTKPWGTGQAVLCARDQIDCPFAVINADDYYGKEAFVKLHEFLCREHQPGNYCMAGFILKNTLSENGGVTRGLCQVDGKGYLTNVVETRNIVKTADGAEVNGEKVDPDTYASMNMWGLGPEFMEMLQNGFEEFFRSAALADPMKSEYLLPIYIGQLLQQGKVSVQVLETRDKWFGVTYREDTPGVVESFRKLIAEGVYQEKLFEQF
jgi:UTP-glucose-1-phosphate uridylyltransferase